jgi:PadR family transcriptional regulator PadR
MRERYGYELVKELSQVPGMGLTEGTLYPLMSRLRLAGLVSTRLEESTSGPARKYYSLTPEGLRTLKTMNVFLETLQRSTQQVGEPT